MQILDKAERLRDMNVNILPAFLRLQEMVSDAGLVSLQKFLSRRPS